MPKRISKVYIHLENYRHNLAVLHEKVGTDTKLMAVLKANAYGHGIERMAKASLEAGASYLGVVSIGELARIRHAGITAPCLILNYLDTESVQEAISLQAEITVMDEQIIKHLQHIAAENKVTVNVHLKIDTGMHRAGCMPQEACRLAALISNAPNLQLAGTFTHFAEAEDASSDFTKKQLQIFLGCVDEIKQAGMHPGLLHCANSATILVHPEAHLDMVRPGILSYGINPFPTANRLHHLFVTEHFRPVLELKSQIVMLKKLIVGESVGYNRRWTAKRESIVALVPIGYGDGFRRTPQNAKNMLVRGQQAPIIGSVSMDQTVIDVTDIPQVNVGDEVVILGKQKNAEITVDDMAEAYGTISYEVVTALSDRLERVYLD